jgi:hypothetical protein
MPTIAQQRTAAVALVVLNCQIAVEPAVTQAEIEAAIDKYKMADIWTLSTPYTVGDVVLPTARNGHRYRCVKGGTSGATEPDWLTRDGATITDGSGETAMRWQEAGMDYANVFDVDGCCFEVLGWKVKRCAVAIDQRLPVGALNASQIYDHWKELRAQYAPLGMG